LTRNVVVNYALGQPDLVTTYTYDPDTLFTPERHLASRKSSVASTGEVNRHEWNRKIHGYGRAADFDHYQYAERKILQIVNEAMANAKAVIVAHAEAFDAAYEELLANDTLSGERLNEILDEHPPVAGSFPTKGPDTPCKPLTSEDEELANGTRVIADPRAKTKHAVEKYYPQVSLEIPHHRDRLEGRPYGKKREDVELVDYMPELKKPPHERFREIPQEPWSVIAMRENLAEDPDWLKKEFKRFTKAADDERLAELRDDLIPALEAKTKGARFAGMPSETDVAAGTAFIGAKETTKQSKESERDGKTFMRSGAHQTVGSDGLTPRERRRLSSYRAELEAITNRWSDPNNEWEPDPNDAAIPPLWRNNLDKTDEELSMRFRLGPDEGTEAYELFQEIKAGFEAGGYVRCWNGKYYKKEECVLTERGTCAARKTLKRRRRGPGRAASGPRRRGSGTTGCRRRNLIALSQLCRFDITTTSEDALVSWFFLSASVRRPSTTLPAAPSRVAHVLARVLACARVHARGFAAYRARSRASRRLGGRGPRRALVPRCGASSASRRAVAMRGVRRGGAGRGVARARARGRAEAPRRVRRRAGPHAGARAGLRLDPLRGGSEQVRPGGCVRVPLGARSVARRARAQRARRRRSLRRRRSVVQPRRAPARLAELH
jgi:hypothetical protein